MKLFIGSGSSDDVPEIYFKDCEELLDMLLKGNDLIYGAYNKGIMNLCVKSAKKNNSKIIGVAPKVYEDDLKELDIDEKISVNNIEERTSKMINMADAIIFFPGGIGTLNEIFSSIDSKRCGEFNKPIIFYNSNHYYDKLFDFLERLYNEKFSPLADKNTYIVTDNKEEVLKILNKEV